MNSAFWLAGFWGGVAGSALLLGAIIGYYGRLSQKTAAIIMAFGSGVLISALSLELMEKAYHHGGFVYTSIGFLSGAVAYTFINFYLTNRGAKHRKSSGKKQSNSGLSIAFGALLDGIPESIVIGLSLIGGGRVSVVAVAAIFLSNIPEGLSSSSGMRKAGRKPGYVFGMWGAICLACAIASLVGYSVFRDFSPEVVAATTASAAGGILAMLADTMMPEAYEYAHDFAGLVTVAGFLASFILSKY